MIYSVIGSHLSKGFDIGIAPTRRKRLRRGKVFQGFGGLGSESTVGPSEVGPAEVGPDEVGPDEVGPSEVGPAEVGPDEVFFTDFN